MKRHSAFSLSVALMGATALCHAQRASNVLVIVADDLGKEVLSIYDTPTKERAVTPNIEKLAQRGITFDNFWGYPLSAPVRAAMLTGRYGHHTGIVDLNINLPTSEVTLFEALPQNYTNGLFGKWHLSQDVNFPAAYGIKHFEGIYRGGGVRDYYNWQFTKNGVTTNCTEYSTTKITNSAKAWIKEQKEPWVCWVAYNSPHTPVHIPPKGTYTQKLKNSAAEMERNELPYFLAMVENLDYEIGRLLEDVDDNTTIIFVGDNGTSNTSLQSPYPARHGKGSLYEAGVSVPLVVCGANVPKSGIRNDEAIASVDIFPTVLELTGKSTPQYEDSYSFSSMLSGGEGQRKYLFSEIMNRRQGYMNALSDREYKIITSTMFATMLFNLKKDPLELTDLCRGTLSKADKEALDRLEGVLKSMNIPEIKATTTQNNKGNRQQMGGGNRQQGGFNNQNRAR